MPEDHGCGRRVKAVEKRKDPPPPKYKKPTEAEHKMAKNKLRKMVK